MFRIKKDINLKELEKFRFEKVYDKEWNEEKEEYERTDNYYYFKEFSYLVDRETGYAVESRINVAKEDRIIKEGMTYLKYERELYEKFVEDTLYDLIIAGMVEKVDE